MINPALGHFALHHQVIVIVFQLRVTFFTFAPDLCVNFWTTCMGTYFFSQDPHMTVLLIAELLQFIGLCVSVELGSSVFVATVDLA